MRPSRATLPGFTGARLFDWSISQKGTAMLIASTRCRDEDDLTTDAGWNGQTYLDRYRHRSLVAREFLRGVRRSKPDASDTTIISSIVISIERRLQKNDYSLPVFPVMENLRDDLVSGYEWLEFLRFVRQWNILPQTAETEYIAEYQASCAIARDGSQFYLAVVERDGDFAPTRVGKSYLHTLGFKEWDSIESRRDVWRSVANIRRNRNLRSIDDIVRENLMREYGNSE
jgi:hypothetical protein